jgi:hypothetical protein
VRGTQQKYIQLMGRGMRMKEREKKERRILRQEEMERMIISRKGMWRKKKGNENGQFGIEKKNRKYIWKYVGEN